METDIEITSSSPTKPAAAKPTPPHLSATAPGQLSVIKRNGKLVSYDVEKIKVAITKAFLAVEGNGAAASARIHDMVDRLANAWPASYNPRFHGAGRYPIKHSQQQYAHP